MSDLSCLFRGKEIPVSFSASVTREIAVKALESENFCTWRDRCEATNNEKRLELHSVEIQNVDMFGPRVGFLKIKADCSLVHKGTHHEKRIPGICFLRGGAVAILVALICEEGDSKKIYSVLVDQPRVPVGTVSCLELPAGMIDYKNDGVKGTAAKELEEECGIKLCPSKMVDMTELACQEAKEAGHVPCSGIAPSPGGSDEFLSFLYAEHYVTSKEIEQMKGKMTGLREEGEYITLSVVPMEDVWKLAVGDAKAICALYLADQLRKEGKLPAVGELEKFLASK